jgi:hypothetical protein
MYGVEDQVKASGPKGWSANGVLRATDLVKTVTLQCDFAEAPGPYTLQFGITGNTGIVGAIDAQAEALITWSVEGNFVTRRVALTNGLSVSGTAEAVRVIIYDVSKPGFATPNAPYNVSVQVVRGTRPAIQQPPTLNPHPFVGDLNTNPPQPYSQTTFTVLPGHILNLPIPNDAGVVSVFIVTTNNAGTTQGMTAAGTMLVIPPDSITVTITGSVDAPQWDPRGWPTWVPVPPGAAEITLQNNQAGGSAVAVDFSVWYGIDG